jgi:hypothetical protein
MIVGLAIWSDAHLRAFNPLMRESEELEPMKNDQEGFISFIVKPFKEKQASS